ncbi:TonB-dependent receptor plug domain-containing protein [Polaribacter filamentus]|nr:TonB-dependent receptor plug domain-containing protein [Polaribacter filamentus]
MWSKSVDAIDLERVEVIKGPGSALYGPGVEAGVVHFITKSPFKNKV